MKNILLTLQNVSARYDNRKTVVRNATLSIGEHDFWGIVGPNGGGKTTLMKLMLGLLRPADGRLTYYRNGVPCRKLRIGYLPQYVHHDKKFPISVHDVILSGLNGEKALWRPYSSGQRERARKIEERLELTSLAQRPIGQLSGGQLQRTLLGRALVANPELLILDEPDTYIDLRSRNHLYTLLREMNLHCAIVLVSHDMETVRQCANRVAYVDGDVRLYTLDELAGAERLSLLPNPVQ